MYFNFYIGHLGIWSWGIHRATYKAILKIRFLNVFHVFQNVYLKRAFHVTKRLKFCYSILNLFQNLYIIHDFPLSFLPSDTILSVIAIRMAKVANIQNSFYIFIIYYITFSLLICSLFLTMIAFLLSNLIYQKKWSFFRWKRKFLMLCIAKFENLGNLISLFFTSIKIHLLKKKTKLR